MGTTARRVSGALWATLALGGLATGCDPQGAAGMGLGGAGGASGAGGAAGRGGSAAGGARVVTRVDPSVVAKGGNVMVTCFAEGADGMRLPTPITEFTVTPDPGGTKMGLMLTPATPGDYTVSCGQPVGMRLPVETATLKVTASELAHVETALMPDTVTAGTRVTVTCTGVGDDGTRTPLSDGFHSTPAIQGMSDTTGVTPTRSGSFEIACNAPPGVDVRSARLTVNAGTATRTKTTLTPETISAGESTSVACLGVDMLGNESPLPSATITTTPPDGATATGAMLRVTRSGTKMVRCDATGITAGDPATLTVNPGLPMTFSMTGMPNRMVYAPGDQVMLAYAAADEFGNVVPSIMTSVSLSDANLGRHVAGSVTLLLSGSLTVTARITSQTAGMRPLSATLTLVIDGTPPAVLITFPPRGAMLTGMNSIAVTGTVTDTSGLRNLAINGQNVTIAPDGTFTQDVTAVHGMNILHVEATDQNNNVNHGVRAFHWATAYKAGTTDAAMARISDGIVARLEQSVFDDNAADVDDFARIMELILANIDFNSFIPSPAASTGDSASCGCSVFPPSTCTGAQGYASNPRFSAPVADLTLQNGGLHFRLRVSNFQVALRATGRLVCVSASVNGNATADSVTIDTDVGISITGGMPRVTMTNTNVSIQNLQLNIDLGVFSSLASALINLFQSAITSAVQNALNSALMDSLPGTLQNFIASFALNTSVTLPAPLSSTIGINANLSSAGFTTAAGLLGLGTAFTSQQSPMLPSSGLGSVLTPMAVGPTLPSGKPMALALSHDAVNQLLYAAWRNSGLHIDGTSLLPAVDGLTVQTLAIDALLPPIILPNKGAAAGQPQLLIQLGDLHLMVAAAAGGQSVMIEGYLSAVAEAGITATMGNRLTIQIGNITQIGVELTNVSAGASVPIAQLSTAFEQALPMLLPQITSSVLSSFELPSFDLGGLGVPGVAPGTRLGIDSLGVTYGPNHVYAAGNVVSR